MPEAKFNFIPAFCPHCGETIKFYRIVDFLVVDYLAGETFTCECGMGFQYVRDLPHDTTKEKPI